MRALFWKDYRLNRSLMYVCAAVVVLMYAVGVVAEIASNWPAMPSAGEWSGMFVSCGTVMVYLAWCVTGVLGGNAIAVERSQRSLHFLACLPLGKMRILASKLAVAAVATALLWGWILLSLYIIAPMLSSAPARTGGSAALSGAAVCVLSFGVGWFASACLEKTMIPIIVALCSPIVVTLGLLLIAALAGISKFEVSAWSSPACVLIGAVAFAAGSWLYVRRVEP